VSCLFGDAGQIPCSGTTLPVGDDDIVVAIEECTVFINLKAHYVSFLDQNIH